jgi:hypothetical protein
MEVVSKYLGRLIIRIEPGHSPQNTNSFLCTILLLQNLGFPEQLTLSTGILLGNKIFAKNTVFSNISSHMSG